MDEQEEKKTRERSKDDRRVQPNHIPLDLMLRNQPWKKNKKRRRRERSRDDNRSQPNHIPLDLTLEILSRLPWKSIMRYRCVSKLWSSFTTHPSFINSFTSRSTSRSPTLLVTISSSSYSDRKYVFSFPQHQIPDGSICPPFYSYPFYGDCPRSKTESIHGLIMSHGLKIWNPTLGQFLALPHPDNSHLHWASYLGFDPLECKHKVLFLSRIGYTDQPQVLTLGSQESWRIITKGRCPSHRPCGDYVRCFNGILYYTTLVLGDDHYVIMSFDVKSESFNIINCPEGRSSYWFHMIPCEGRLALVNYEYPYDDVKLYILKDARGDKWTREDFVLHLPYGSIRSPFLSFMGTTDAGEFIFAPYYEAFYIIYFDPRRNSTRQVFFERNLDEFRRRCGLNSKDKFTMEVYPNHIESLFSL